MKERKKLLRKHEENKKSSYYKFLKRKSFKMSSH